MTVIELHLLQNFAPSNLNRDDTGQPKDCQFGGVRRARISSQCLKRAVRQHFTTGGLLPREALAVRTKHLVDELGGRLVAAGEERGTARAVAEAALASVGLAVAAPKKTRPDERLTQYLVFAGWREIEAVARVCLEHRGALASGKAPPAAVTKAIRDALDGGRAADLALFGRMLADLPPEHQVAAACQVAHALSTHAVSVEFDFYTAVDDLAGEHRGPEDVGNGAGMMGTVEFNSATYYRYASVDTAQLLRNLKGDQQSAQATVDAFLRAAVEATPSGKQNSFAAYSPPSLVLAVVRERGRWSLVNAFADPVRPGRGERPGEGLVERSIAALDGYWGSLRRLYGDGSVGGAWVATLHPEALTTLAGARVETLEELVRGAVAAAFAGAATLDERLAAVDGAVPAAVQGVIG